MKTTLIASLLLGASLSFGKPESAQLDGVWQGKESYYIVGGVGIGTAEKTTKPVTVIISDGGSMVGIVGGCFIKPVRFTGHWTKDGLTVYPPADADGRAGPRFAGRAREGQTIDKTNHITLTLNGDKLVENGLFEYVQTSGSEYANHQKAYGNLSGELHRATMADGARAIGSSK
jgi:hypothetical protein